MQDHIAATPADKAQMVWLWDLPLRILCDLHRPWELGKFGPDVMALHFRAGSAVIGLLAYLRHVPVRRPSLWPGHNPMGGLFVVLFLCWRCRRRPGWSPIRRTTSIPGRWPEWSAPGPRAWR